MAQLCAGACRSHLRLLMRMEARVGAMRAWQRRAAAGARAGTTPEWHAAARNQRCRNPSAHPSHPSLPAGVMPLPRPIPPFTALCPLQCFPNFTAPVCPCLTTPLCNTPIAAQPLLAPACPLP
eukprot:364762-Chlamydomonas_euryale.AAC.5